MSGALSTLNYGSLTTDETIAAGVLAVFAIGLGLISRNAGKHSGLPGGPQHSEMKALQQFTGVGAVVLAVAAAYLGIEASGHMPPRLDLLSQYNAG